MGKQSGQHSISLAHPFDDPNWSLIMAVAWIDNRTSEAIEGAARGYGTASRAAVERLLRELRAGRLTAWARVDGKSFAIAPQHWRALEPVFVRKRFLPRFAEDFGRLVITVRDGTDKELRDVTISSEAMQQMFPVDAPVIAIVVPRHAQSRRDRARRGLEGRFGKKIPAPTEMSDRILYKETTNWLARHDPLPKGYSEVSLNTVLRAARRKK